MRTFTETFTPPAIVLLTVHNSATTLGTTLASIEKQAYPNTRLVTVVDPSNDNSLDILKAFAETSGVSTVIITNKDTLGEGKSFNRGLLWIAQEAKKAIQNEPNILWNNIESGLLKHAGVALQTASASMHVNRIVSAMVMFQKNVDTHFVYGDPADNVIALGSSRKSHVDGWTLKLWWLLNLKTAAIFDVVNDYMDGWPTFVQMLGAGPAVHLKSPVFSYIKI